MKVWIGSDSHGNKEILNELKENHKKCDDKYHF